MPSLSGLSSSAAARAARAGLFTPKSPVRAFNAPLTLSLTIAFCCHYALARVKRRIGGLHRTHAAHEEKPRLSGLCSARPAADRSDSSAATTAATHLTRYETFSSPHAAHVALPSVPLVNPKDSGNARANSKSTTQSFSLDFRLHRDDVALLFPLKLFYH